MSGRTDLTSGRDTRSAPDYVAAYRKGDYSETGLRARI